MTRSARSGRIQRKGELSADTYASRRGRLDARLAEMIDADWQDTNAGRLAKRLMRHQNDVFTFLDQEGVPFDNNHAERSIRPAVILRKNSYGNRSGRGADCQAALMRVPSHLKTTRPQSHPNHDPRHRALHPYRKTTSSTTKKHFRRLMCYEKTRNPQHVIVQLGLI
jgi:hypothetical protein